MYSLAIMAFMANPGTFCTTTEWLQQATRSTLKNILKLKGCTSIKHTIIYFIDNRAIKTGNKVIDVIVNMHFIILDKCKSYNHILPENKNYLYHPKKRIIAIKSTSREVDQIIPTEDFSFSWHPITKLKINFSAAFI